MTRDPGLLARGLGPGLVNGLLLSAIMVPAFLAGMAPMPQPPSLAFAEVLLGDGLPLPVGLAFHLAWVALWSAVWVGVDHPRLHFATALALGLGLWVAALAIFFPLNGRGFLGLGVGPALVPAALVPHLLFAVLLRGLGRLPVPAAGAPSPAATAAAPRGAGCAAWRPRGARARRSARAARARPRPARCRGNAGTCR